MTDLKYTEWKELKNMKFPTACSPLSGEGNIITFLHTTQYSYTT